MKGLRGGYEHGGEVFRLDEGVFKTPMCSVFGDPESEEWKSDVHHRVHVSTQNEEELRSRWDELDNNRRWSLKAALAMRGKNSGESLYEGRCRHTESVERIPRKGIGGAGRRSKPGGRLATVVSLVHDSRLS